MGSVISTQRTLTWVYCTIPGEPCAQGRARASIIGGHVRMYDPKKSSSWKGAAQVHMKKSMEELDFKMLQKPFTIYILASFKRPVSTYSKRKPKDIEWHGKRGDVDNIAKAVLDAGTGILWRDDALCSMLTVEKVIGAQGAAPFVSIAAGELKGAPNKWVFLGNS